MMDREAQLNVKQSHCKRSNHIQLLPLRARPQKSHYMLTAKSILYIIHCYHQQNWDKTKQMTLKQQSDNVEEMLSSFLQCRRFYLGV